MIERTFDTQLVREILSDEELRKRGGKYIPVEAYDPENQQELIYLLVKDEDKVLGVILYHVFNHPICFQAHVNYLPKYWGSGLIKYTLESVDWIYSNTDCQKIVALIPEAYPEVIKHAQKAGLKIEGNIEKSIMVNDKLDNQVIMGGSKWQRQEQ
jgi:hypothetical protein